MTLSTLDAFLSGMQSPQGFTKASATTEGAGTWHSLWKLAGQPTAGSNPPAISAGSGYSCSRTTVGAIPFANPGSGETKLSRFLASSTVACSLVLYDRLWAVSGFACNTTSGQSVTTPGTIPSRDNAGTANGAGVELWGEFYSAPGATGGTWTVLYTDQDGNTSQSATYTHPANAETAGQMVPFVLASGDTGVRGLTATNTLTLGTSSGTAGDFGLTLLRRISSVPLQTANIPVLLDALQAGATKIYDDSCLALMILCTTTSSGVISGDISWSQG